ncbi:MAG: ATP-binding protein [Myxococcota bacterium]
MIASLPRLFLRTYLVIAAVLLAGLIMAGGWGFALRSPPDNNALEALMHAPGAVERAFDGQPAVAATAQVAAELDAEVRLHRVEDLAFKVPPHVYERLSLGELVGPPPGMRPIAWMPVGEGLVVEVRPNVPSPPPIPFIAVGVLLGLGVALITLLRPLDRELRALEQAAQEFGQGDRAARVETSPNAATAKLAERFNAMADRIAQLLESQRDLLLAVSHEVRTPLNRLRFAVELLADEDDAEARDSKLQALHHDLDELDDLVAELLTFYRLEQSAPPSLGSTALEPLVEGLVADAARLRPGIQATCRDVNHAVWANPGLLRRALSKVIANAARYADSQLLVTAHSTTGVVRVYIDDDGPGIPSEDRIRVLEPFVRLDGARDRDAGGSGLGLAVVNRIVTAHGGSLVITDAPLGGARIMLSWPRPLTRADMA